MRPLDLGSNPWLGLSPTYPSLPVAWVWRLAVAMLAFAWGMRGAASLVTASPSVRWRHGEWVPLPG